MNKIFTLWHQNQYNLRNWTHSAIPKAGTVNYGFEGVKYLGSKIWEIIPKHVKELDTIDKFKIAIKNGNQIPVFVGYANSIYII